MSSGSSVPTGTPRHITDPNVWPTSGDIAIGLRDGAYVVADVRAGSAADDRAAALHRAGQAPRPPLRGRGRGARRPLDGTPREDFRGDVWLDAADRDPQGGDPAMAAAEAWLSAE